MLFKKIDNAEIDFSHNRERMVKEQLAARGILDEAVLSAMRTVPRHLFVPDEHKPSAYNDGPLPIGHDQTISQPYVVASMTEHLNLNHNSRVLEIGTGSGYQAAVLAEIAKEVYTVEIVPELLQTARELFKKLYYHNIKTKLGDGSQGWKEYQPFNAIIVTAATPKIPEALIEQLSKDGTMLLPLKGASFDSQELVKVTRTPQGLIKKTLYQVRFVPMRGDVEKKT